MIKVGDMVGFEYRNEHHLAIIIEDLGAGYPYGRFTGLIVGSDGDLIPLDAEDLTVLANRFQLESWEKKKKLRKILDKSKPT